MGRGPRYGIRRRTASTLKRRSSRDSSAIDKTGPGPRPVGGPRRRTMSPYSHRDHRISRDTSRLLAAVSAGTVALVVVAYLAPWATFGALAVLAMAALGGV